MTEHEAIKRMRSSNAYVYELKEIGKAVIRFLDDLYSSDSEECSINEGDFVEHVMEAVSEQARWVSLEEESLTNHKPK